MTCTFVTKFALFRINNIVFHTLNNEATNIKQKFSENAEDQI